MEKSEFSSQATAAIVEHFRKLDLEVKNWENYRNEQGGFDLDFGVSPSVISVSVHVNNNGEAVAIYKQTPGHEVLEKYEEDGFAFFLNTNAISNHHSVISFYHETMNYLYLNTSKADFKFNLYLDWMKAKKDLDAAFSIYETQDESDDNEGEDDLTSKLYRLGLVLATGQALKDHSKTEWANKRISDLKAEQTKRIFKTAHMQAKSQVKLPNYDEARDTPLYGAPFLDHLNSVFVARSEQLTWTWKPIIAIPDYISNMVCVSEVNLAWTKLTSVPQALFQLPFVRKMFLNNNQLLRIPSVGGCPLLEVLDLRSNRLCVLPADIHFLPILSSLDVSKNALRTIPPLLSSCKRLSYLDISGNLLMMIPPEIGLLQNLSNFNYSGNPLMISPPDKSTEKTLEWLKKKSDRESGIGWKSFVEQVSSLFRTSSYADLILKPRGAKAPVSAHRIVILSRAPKFYAKLLKLEMGAPDVPGGNPKPQPPKDANGRFVVPLNDLDPATLDLLLIWCYTDKFDPELPKVRVVKPKSPTAIEDEMAQQQEIAQRSRILNKVLKMCESYDLIDLHRRTELLLGISKPVYASADVPNFNTIFRAFCRGKILSDVTLVVGEAKDRVPAHKAVLSVRSPFFANTLNSPMLESVTGEIPLPDLTLSACHSILTYIYCGEVVVDPENVFDVLAFAALAELNPLFKAVETIVSHSLDNDNLLYILDLAVANNWQVIVDACVSYWLNNRATLCKVLTLSPEQRKYLTGQPE